MSFNPKQEFTLSESMNEKNQRTFWYDFQIGKGESHARIPLKLVVSALHTGLNMQLAWLSNSIGENMKHYSKG
jgi:hypothetical protein